MDAFLPLKIYYITYLYSFKSYCNYIRLSKYFSNLRTVLCLAGFTYSCGKVNESHKKVFRLNRFKIKTSDDSC